MKTTIPESMYGHLRMLVGVKLNEIIVNYFYVVFVFTGSKSYRLKINKRFRFSLHSNQSLKFIADASEHDVAIESTNFVYLQGKCCVGAEISPMRLHLTFADEAVLSVEFEDKDFEPIEFIGFSGDQNEKLEFYYVL